MVPLKMGLIFGGRSGEHKVSILSAASVYRAATYSGLDVVGIGVTRKGQWVYLKDCDKFFSEKHTEVTVEMGPSCHILPDPCRSGLWVTNPDGSYTNLPLEVIFPVLHGPFGEDGTIQGLLENSGIPYVGAPTLASAICMDKDTTKRICKVTTYVPWMCIRLDWWQGQARQLCDEVLNRFKLPVFVKPSGSGSSLGVSKVKDPSELVTAIEKAFEHDNKVLVEPSQEGCQEIECAVLGNQEPKASTVGEIVPRREFYDYKAKYEDKSTILYIPARINRDLIENQGGSNELIWLQIAGVWQGWIFSQTPGRER